MSRNDKETQKEKSIVLYKRIFTKACKCRWEIRSCWIIVSFITLMMTSCTLGVCLYDVNSKRMWTILIIVGIITILFNIPLIGFLYARKSEERSKIYIEFLKEEMDRLYLVEQ